MSGINQNERKPQYNVEVFMNNCWCHRTWRKNELSAVTMCEVESKSRRKAMRVIFEGKTIFECDKHGKSAD